MISSIPFHYPEDRLLKVLRQHYQADENVCVDKILTALKWDTNLSQRIEKTATKIVEVIRSTHENHGGLDAFLHEYKLSSREGVALMCLAEALLRVPDSATANRLIEDKLGDADWAAHLGNSDSFLVNASTWALMLTGKVLVMDEGMDGYAEANFRGVLSSLVARAGEPLLCAAIGQAMKIMGGQFVLAESIEKGIKVARKKQDNGYTYSYDMLGEAAKTNQEAVDYLRAYEHGIQVIGESAEAQNPHHNPGISVKLSALHARYEYIKEASITSELYPRLKTLCVAAKTYNIGLTIDAEESERLEPSLHLLRMLCQDSDLKQWNGLGFVVQAYQKRAPYVLDWIGDLARSTDRKIMIRLVKGAYWDTEIKTAQIEGFSGYPVYTRKISTDVAYLYCAQKLLQRADTFYPLFATHNAHTVAAILEFAKKFNNKFAAVNGGENGGENGAENQFEFQCLHGMGEILYDHVIQKHNINCRIYAPVGAYKDLLAYLVRRLLENGANSSFVNRLIDRELPIAGIVADPVALLRELAVKSHADIPVPNDIFADRKNSSGINFNNPLELSQLATAVEKFKIKHWEVKPLLAQIPASANSDSANINAAKMGENIAEYCINPASGEIIGTVMNTPANMINQAVLYAKSAYYKWDLLGGSERAKILRIAADLYEQHRAELLAICMLEAGKTLNDAIAEIREAIDFLRYYANQAEREFTTKTLMPGPTGEKNQWSLHGRGVFVCISPWNFPLAIFTGQVSAALAAGNSVLAKPAEQTPIIAARAVELFHQAGIPRSVLQFLPGSGEKVGAALIENEHIAGVTFTGSSAVAKIIQRTLAQKSGAIIPFIAETGGLNCMLVDSTALPQQVVRDVIQSAFQSAGQRCSALRVLYLQEDVADDILDMLKGAMAELKIGNPQSIDTDIGPIIDRQALAFSHSHIKRCAEQNFPIYYGAEIQGAKCGNYQTPVIIEINHIADLKAEVFAPILHICRYAAKDIDGVIDDINRSGYGLTFGIHSRIHRTIETISSRIQAGNIYINRNMIGAVVGVQPFGGQGLSGTGPKAGGPLYLHRFAHERCTSNDTSSSGGNTDLMSLEYL